jgi:hypothetical protein
MINPTGKKLEKIIFKLFDDASQGVDRYNHNGSLWVIFTNETKWVVEFAKNQTLWYNYNFFKDEMELIGLDCVKNKDLIKKWFESRFLGIPKVEDFCEPFFDQDQYVEDTIQNGVKHTAPDASTIVYAVEDTIQKGVKQTELSKRDFFPKDILQNGVKETKSLQIHLKKSIKDTIQKGVRMTKSTIISQDSKVEDTIQNGVKETHDDCSNNIARVEGIVRIGEKLN